MDEELKMTCLACSQSFHTIREAWNHICIDEMQDPRTHYQLDR